MHFSLPSDLLFMTGVSSSAVRENEDRNSELCGDSAAKVAQASIPRKSLACDIFIPKLNFEFQENDGD